MSRCIVEGCPNEGVLEGTLEVSEADDPNGGKTREERTYPMNLCSWHASLIEGELPTVSADA